MGLVEGLHASTGLEKSSEELTLLSMPLSTHSAAQLLSARLHLLAVSRLGGALTQGDPEHGATDEPDGTLITLITLSSHPPPSPRTGPHPNGDLVIHENNEIPHVLTETLRVPHQVCKLLKWPEAAAPHHY